MQEEFDRLAKNYIILQHKVEILEQENKRLTQDAAKNDEEIARMKVENSLLKHKQQ